MTATATATIASTTLAEAGPTDVPMAMTSEIAYRHVLVPLDGSRRSLSAMPTARALAAAFDADLHTISVARNERHQQRLRSLAAATLEPIGGRGEAVVTADGRVAATVVRHAEALHPALICVATRARGRVGRALTGGIANDLVERGAPVVVVGPVAERPTWSPIPRGWPAPLSSSRIVTVVDGTPGSEAALAPAMAWAETLGKSLTIVAVVADAPPPIRPTHEASDIQDPARAHEYVQHLAGRWQADAVQVSGRVVRDPLGPGSGLRAHLARTPASLVVVSRDFQARFRFACRSATATDIVRSSTAPCLVVP